MTTVMVKKVPDSLKKQFKAACIMKGVTMQDAIKDFMKQYSVGRQEPDADANKK